MNDVNFKNTKIVNSNLNEANCNRAVFDNAIICNCSVYGASFWECSFKETDSKNISILKEEEKKKLDKLDKFNQSFYKSFEIDNIEFAQIIL